MRRPHASPLRARSLPQEARASERLVCHFYRSSRPCDSMHRHLALLAAQHLETKFVKLQAEKAPFLTGEKESAREAPT